MRRRFTLAIVGVVAGALVVAGLGTLLLLTLQNRRDARRDVTQLASRIAAESARAPSATDRVPSLVPLANFLRHTEELSIISVGPRGRARSALPGGLDVADLRPPSLGEGHTVSGFHGGVAFAAVPFTPTGRPGTRLAVIVTRRTSGAGSAGLYFLLAAGIALVVAFGVAASLARRITRPLVGVEQASRHIAQGDFATRAPPPPRGSYPELASLSASINAMADNLERLRGQERQFLLSVSHDLRTPLTSIRGFAEALTDGTATDTPAAAGIIAAEARRLERLVGDLLELAKLGARRFGLDLRPTDLWEVVNDTAHGFDPAAERLGLTLVVADPVHAGPLPVSDATQRLHTQSLHTQPLPGQPLPGQPLPGEALPRPGPVGAPRVAADPDRLAQVIANLVENALSHATSGIAVGTWYAGDGEAMVTVDDDGAGIPAQDLPHVFDRLWTTSRGRARSVGSGLGLAIVAELVAAMGGTVRAESPVPVPPRRANGATAAPSGPAVPSQPEAGWLSDGAGSPHAGRPDAPWGPDRRGGTAPAANGGTRLVVSLRTTDARTASPAAV